MKYSGTIFKIPFPFTDLSASKARPALAVSEPDDLGDIQFIFITTKQTRLSADTLDLPENTLPFALPLISIWTRYSCGTRTLF